MLSEGNVEPYLPNAWTEEEASVLAHLVGLYGPTNWSIIAAGVATKSETQVKKQAKQDQKNKKEKKTKEESKQISTSINKNLVLYSCDT